MAGDKKKGKNNEQDKESKELAKLSASLFSKRVGYEDMTTMENMTLEGVLSNLKDRFLEDLIYVCI